jgi:monomeric sarcosine oxidase
VRLAQRALGMWREAESEAGEELVRTTGGLDLGPGVASHAEALEACGVPSERLDGAEVAGRFPGVSVAEGIPALFQPDAGIALAERAVSSFARLAEEGGIEVREATRVTAIEPDMERVDVRTEDGVISARSAVVTAGAWARSLLAPIGIDLPVRPTRETVAYFRNEGSVPSIVEWGTPAVYGLLDPAVGIKAGVHHADRDTDPELMEGPDPDSVARLSAWVAERFPGADAEPHSSETCLYTNTADESFVLERRGAVVIGSACSGHGFKFAPAIGSRLARLALDRN